MTTQLGIDGGSLCRDESYYLETVFAYTRPNNHLRIYPPLLDLQGQAPMPGSVSYDGSRLPQARPSLVFLFTLSLRPPILLCSALFPTGFGP